MRHMRVVGLWAVIAIVAGALAAPAGATTLTYMLDQSNTFADGVNYGQVTLTDNLSEGTVTITFQAFDNVYSGLSNFGMQKVGLNPSSNVMDAHKSGQVFVSSIPDGWTADWSGGNMDGFGEFQVLDGGTGSNRAVTVTLTFAFAAGDLNLANVYNFVNPSGGNPGQPYGPFHFAAHVAGFNGNQDTSHFIADGEPPPVPVPEPGSLALLALGAAGLAAAGRAARRRQGR